MIRIIKKPEFYKIIVNTKNGPYEKIIGKKEAKKPNQLRIKGIITRREYDMLLGLTKNENATHAIWNNKPRIFDEKWNEIGG